MTPRDQPETLVQLKEKYSNDLDAQKYDLWLRSVERLVALKTSWEKFKQSTIMPTAPEQTLKNLYKEIEFAEKIVIEIEKLKDIITSGIVGIDEKRVDSRVADIIVEADAIARDLPTSPRNETLKRQSKSVPSSKEGFFGTHGQNPVKRKPAKAQSAPPKITVNDEEVDLKKVHEKFSLKPNKNN